MAGSLEAFRIFNSQQRKPKPTQSTQDIPEAGTSTESKPPTADPSAVRPLTPPIEASTADEIANYSEEIVPAPTAAQTIVTAAVPTNPSAIAKPAQDAATANGIPTVADTEAGTLLGSLTQPSMNAETATATKGISLKDGFAKSTILQKLAAGRDVAADSSIASAADVEAGTALIEVLPQNANANERGQSISSTGS